MATKKTDKYASALAEAEKSMLAKVEETRGSLETDRHRLPGFEEALEATEDAVDGLEGSARAGDPSVTGKALAEARGDREVAQMALDGCQKRIQRLSDRLGKVNTRKDIAEVVRDALLARMVPGAAAYATFAGVKDAKPDTLPALVVTQLDGGIGNDGVGNGKVRISWLREDLHAPMEGERLHAALEASGFQIRSEGLNSNGAHVRRMEGADIAEVTLRGVSEQIPTVRSPLTDVRGWDFQFAQQVNNSFDKIEAEEFGARIVSQEVNDDIRTTVVRIILGARPNTRITAEAQDINVGAVVMNEARKWVEQTRSGAGRCVGVERGEMEPDKVTAIQARSLELHPMALEFTFTAKTN